MHVFSVIALIDGSPVACWVLANDRDEATAKASGRLPAGGRISVVVPLCTASLTQFERNQLHKLLPLADGAEFVGRTLVELIQCQRVIIARQREQIELVADLVRERIETLENEEN